MLIFKCLFLVEFSAVKLSNKQLRTYISNPKHPLYGRNNERLVIHIHTLIHIIMIYQILLNENHDARYNNHICSSSDLEGTK